MRRVPFAWIAFLALACVLSHSTALREVRVPLPPSISPVDALLTTEFEARIAAQAADLPVPQKARLLDMYQGTELLTDGRLDEAKVRALSGGLGLGNVHDFYPVSAEFSNRLQEIVMNDTTAGVPALLIEECLHGYQQGGHTSFPAPLGLAATWHPELVEDMAHIIALEARAYGVRMCLAPVLGAAREPRWGRSEETYGEDPFLIAAFARHFVWGLQGRALSNATVIAEPKHYAAHSIPEGGRNTAVSHVGPREMLDTFLPQFEAAVRAGALSIMSAYSEYDGVPCSASHYLLTQKLRQDFGFKGFVLSDLGAVALLANSHRVAATAEDGIKQFLIAGGNSQFYDYSHAQFQDAIINGVADGSLPLSTLNDRVADLLRVRALLHIDTQPTTDPALAARDVNTASARALALQLAKESIVLLKNGDVGGMPLLPLAPRVRAGTIKRLAVIGPLALQLEVADYAGPFNVVNNAQSAVLFDALSARAVRDSTAVLYGGGVWPTLGTDSAVISRAHFPRGVSASYHTSADLTGAAALNRTEAMIASTFYLYGFDPRFPSNTFSARWTGAVVWPATVPNGRLLVNTGDGGRARLTLDGKVVVEQFATPGKCQPCAVPYAFVAGETHSVLLEYGQTGQGQEVSLSWDLVGDDTDASIARSLAVAGEADAVVVAVGDNGHTSGEGVDRISLDLSGRQEELVHALAALGKPLVVVLYSGRAQAIPLLASSANVTAIVEAYEPGQSQGEALEAVLYGEFNPGGRLPLTYPHNVGQVPLFYAHKGTGWPTNYEDLNPSQPVYWFGHGLSYSTFAYSNLSISPARATATSTVTVAFTVTNTSPVNGSDTPQLYLTDRVSSTTTPDRALRGFVRVQVAAHESVRVVLSLNVSVDCRLVDQSLQWTVEEGEFDVAIATDSSDEGTKLKGNFSVVASPDALSPRVANEEERRRATREDNERLERERLARLAAQSFKTAVAA